VIVKTRLLILTLLSIIVIGPSPAIAEDYIGVEVEVVGTENAPQVTASMKVPIGKKSDAAKVSLKIRGLEPSKPVLFTVSPLPDAIARFKSDSQGSLTATIELPYGLEPGPHNIDALSFFSAEDISVLYTVGRIYVNDFGILTESDGYHPVGTKPVKVLLPNAEEQFLTPPSYQGQKGTLRVSDPQIRITQGLLPSMSVVMSFNNDTDINGDFEVKMSLFTIFGTLVSEPFYSRIDSIPPGGTQAVLLEFPNLPPIGFFTLKTELILADNFVSDKSTKTSYVSSVFAPPLAFIFALLLLIVILFLFVRWKRSSIQGSRK
jgi:hypothetical protein